MPVSTTKEGGIMFYVWLLIMWLAPNVGCLLFVYVAPHPDVMTALAGAVFGLAVSIMAFFSVT